MLRAICKAASDNEIEDRVAAGRDSVERHANGDNVYGLPKLAEMFNEKAASKAAAWLGYSSNESAEKEPKRPPPEKRSLDEVHAVFRKWFGDHFDLDVVDATCAAAAAERLKGDRPG